MALYKLRQQIVEHPFGTIKFTMRGNYFLLRTRRKVCSEVALLFISYNLKRAYAILGFHELMARLDSIAAYFQSFIMKMQNFECSVKAASLAFD
ncbi:MAG: hypothetical protein BWY11_02220 [Firmicutes bacterium ADurb.Bin182]|nr:MAG: hypothetical protein BWY11_02220 [Firmicutes bacterium ADurb.Bin182]